MSKFETTVVPFHNNITHKRRAKKPSFSSILLDAIYRSIDEDDDLHDYPRTTPTSPTRSIIKQNDCNEEVSKHRRNKMRSDSTLETVDLRRAIMIESWVERQQQPQQPPQQPPQQKHFHLGDVLDQKIRIVRQKSVPSIPRASDNSTTTMNDFSSSSSSLCFTNLTPRSSARDHPSSRIFTKTKSRALKIYSELKKSKQQNTAPISPGRRIAAFLNSIFRNGGGSPARNSTEMKLNPPTTTNSTCSSASSFSRSCLSNKTPSSSSWGKSSSTPGTKRSVRFYPVSVIVDEDSRPCGHKSLQKNENQEFKNPVSPLNIHGPKSGEQQRIQRREKEIDALMMMIKTNCGNIQQRHVSSFNEVFDNDDDDEEMEEEEDDDNGSCASSDLFELENLSSIGVSRYYEELPVYGTTSLKNLTA